MLPVYLPAWDLILTRSTGKALRDGSSSDSLHWCRGTARRQAQAEHKADVLAEENASLILELDARPTAKQYKSLQRQMDILERRLDESKAEAQGCAFQDLACCASWCSSDVTHPRFLLCKLNLCH